MLKTLKKYLSGFVVLTDTEFSQLAAALEVRKFDRRRQLTAIGEVENYLNFLVEGLARMYFTKGKTEIITHIAKENEMISSTSSFLSGSPSNYIIETLEPCTFVSISRDSLEGLYAANPNMERLGRLMTTYFYLQKKAWEYESVRLDIRERFIRFMQANPDLLKRVPQKYLASYLNMKPETFSRLKHLLNKRPLLKGGPQHQ